MGFSAFTPKRLSESSLAGIVNLSDVRANQAIRGGVQRRIGAYEFQPQDMNMVKA